MGKKKNQRSKNKARCNEKSNEKENNQEIIHEAQYKSSLETVPKKASVFDETDLFDKYNGKSKRISGREYFVHSLCQVCKEEVEAVESCAKCGLVRYCSAQHRREHWPVHADVCAAVQDIAGNRGRHIMAGAHNLSPDQFRLFRFQNMTECEAKLERPLEKWEREMFVFPNVCSKCYEHKPSELATCEWCRHTAFCLLHRADTDSHSAWCRYLRTYKDIVRNRHEYGVVCPEIPRCRMITEWPVLTDSERFFRGISHPVDRFELLELSEIASYPLTVLNALAKLRPLNKVQLVLHVVGAEAQFETDSLHKWEYYVLHLIPDLTELRIEFVGPELSTQAVRFSQCSECCLAGKRITFGFHTGLYHEVSSLAEPDLICAFNPGLYRVTGFGGRDTWGPCLARLLSGPPLLVTAYTKREAALDIKRLITSAPQLRSVVPPSLNPFASLKPDLNFVSEEDSPVVFKNLFYFLVNKE